MEKAFDVKDLEARLKAKGMTEVEDVAQVIYSELMDWLVESAPLHPNALVQTLLPVMVMALRPIGQKYIDDIDGQQG